MKSNTRTTHHAHPDIAPDQARDARARAWMFVFECWEQRKAAAKDGSEEYVRKEQCAPRNRTTT
jgi:hypothetical protein